MIVYRVNQGSAEWHKVRSGVITASNFKLARERVGTLTDQQQAYVGAIRAGMDSKAAAAAADYKSKPKHTEAIERAIAGLTVGDFSDKAKNQAFRLAIERISGEPLRGGYETWEMERGHELEPVARVKHEIAKGVLVDTVGFVATDDRLFGASADGFIEQDGGAEYKCFLSPEKLRAIVLSGDVSEVMDQCQGGMWITGRKWWHFALYCPALEPVGRDLTIFEIARDDDYIEAMERDLIEYAALVASYEAALREPMKEAA